MEDYPNLFSSGCPSATMQVIDSQISGSQTFGVDGAYSMDTDFYMQAQVDIDTQECFSQTCAEFEVSLQQTDLDMTCTDAGGSCQCIWTNANVGSTTGTYEVTSAGYVVTTDGGQWSPQPFCLEADGLTTWSEFNEFRFEQWACSTAEECETLARGEPDTEGYEWSCVEQQ